MALRTASVTGLWSDTATWGGESVPGSSDWVVINNLVTVTLDDATDETIQLSNSGSANYYSINIAAGGKLQYLYTAGENKTLELTGNLYIAGTLEIGTTAHPIPSTRTFRIEIECASDGERGITIPAGGVMTLQGADLGGWKTKMSADAIATNTHIHVASTTGFAIGDDIVIAGTRRGATMEWERRTLTGATTTLDFTDQLLYPHDGATDPIQADVIQLKRNIVVTANTAANVTYVYATGSAQIDCDWVEFSYLGENATNKRGIELNATTGACTFDYCSIHNCEDWGFYASGNYASVALRNCAAYNLNSSATTALHGIYLGATTGSSNTISDVILIGGNGSTSTGSGIYIVEEGLTVSGLTVASWGGTGYGASGIYLVPGSTVSSTSTWSSLKIYSCANTGIAFGALNPGLTIDGIITFRVNGSSGGIHNIANNASITIKNSKIISCGSTQNIYIDASMSGIVFNNVRIYSESSYTTSYDIYIPAGRFLTCEIISCDFSNGSNTATYNIYAAASPNCVAQVICRSTKWGTNPVSPLTSDLSFVRSEDTETTVGSMKTWTRYGTIEKLDGASARGGSGSCGKMIPNSATAHCLKSGYRQVAVASGQTVTPHVYVYETATYNGTRAGLYVRKNTRMGITSDTLLDTATAASDEAWEELTGTTVAVSADGVIEFYVACDGTATAGALYVDDWSVT